MAAKEIKTDRVIPALKVIHILLWQRLDFNACPPKKLRQQAFTAVLKEVASDGRRLFMTRRSINGRCLLVAPGLERRKRRRRWLEVFWLNYQQAIHRQRMESIANMDLILDRRCPPPFPCEIRDEEIVTFKVIDSARPGKLSPP